MMKIVTVVRNVARLNFVQHNERGGVIGCDVFE